MTLDEAIKHCEEKTNMLLNEARLMPDYSEDKEPCIECANEHRQLAEWLKELKAYKENQESQIDLDEYKSRLVSKYTDGDEATDFDKGITMALDLLEEMEEERS